MYHIHALTLNQTVKNFNQHINCSTPKGGIQRYHDVKYILMVYNIKKKWLDNMIQNTCISVDHNNEPYHKWLEQECQYRVMSRRSSNQVGISGKEKKFQPDAGVYHQS